MADDITPKEPIRPEDFLLPKTDPGFSARAVGGVAPEDQKEEALQEFDVEKAEHALDTPQTNPAPATPQPEKKSDEVPTPTPATPQQSGTGFVSSILKPLRTYRGDVENTIKETRASVVSIASAEEERRAKMGARVLESNTRSRSWTIALIASAILIFAGAGVLVYFFASTPSPEEKASRPAQFLYVDEETEIDATDADRTNLMTGLVVARNDTSLALGLVRQVYFTESTGTSTRALLPSTSLLTTLAPGIPNALLRTLSRDFMLGIHVFEGNQPFLILKTDSYEHSFAGLLEWELRMREDLAPLFTRTPRPALPGQSAGGPGIQFLASPFVDRIVDNRDTRVIEDSFGNITLLWTFLDRSTILITTNEYTLREVVSRLKNAPILPEPGA